MSSRKRPTRAKKKLMRPRSVSGIRGDRLSPFLSSTIAVFFLCAISMGTIAGWMLGKRGIPFIPQAYLQDFDQCGFGSKALCQSGCSGGFPESCYHDVLAGEWCCPVGCTIEEVCGNMLVERNGTLPDEECDNGGTCTGGVVPNCNTVENAKRCIATGGTCNAQDTGASDTCDASCVSKIVQCGNGTCEAALGETCLTCASDCVCGPGKVCNVAGVCVSTGDGGVFCGNGTVNAGEQCDDGNIVNGDGCSAACVCEACGDNYKCATEQCDDGNTTSGDGCSGTCVKEPTCTDGIKNQDEKQVDCGGSVCAACPCSSHADCNDGAYCTEDTCSGGSCVYTPFGGVYTNPCSRDYERICVNPASCACNENTDRCELCNSATEDDCKKTSNALCQDHGIPTGCRERAANQWCCPGRE